ncbi:hypothetical protein AHAS_Ahas20G0190800 [Arachis hypogaea]
MSTRKGKEKASKKPPTKRTPHRSTTKARPTLKVKPPSKRVNRVIHIDEKEKGNPAKNSTRFTNHFCELMFPILVERNYHSEHLLVPPERLVCKSCEISE